ncbi:MAG: hypothetical protein ACYSOO_05135 [Planctomycetota bacterium]
MAHFHCAKCKIDMHVEKVGVGVDYGNFHVYPGVLILCPVCGFRIVWSIGRANYDEKYENHQQYLVMEEAKKRDIYFGSRACLICKASGNWTKDPEEQMRDAQDVGHEMSNEMVKLTQNMYSFKKIINEASMLALGEKIMDAEEPAIVISEDGFRFERQADGSYTDGDMTFLSYEDFYKRCYGKDE